MAASRLLTPEEERLCDQLGMCFLAFCKLPILHDNDQPEFCQAIHACQNIIMARPVLREIKEDAGG